jgi:transposase
LPAYSPNLNLIERLWKFFKKKVLKNKYYSEFDDFFQAILDFCKNISLGYKNQISNLLNQKFEIIKSA